MDSAVDSEVVTASAVDRRDANVKEHWAPAIIGTYSF